MSFLNPINLINWYVCHAHTGITVKRACNYLAYALQNSNDVVKFAGKEVAIWELGAHPELADLPANILKIKFSGGPPGAYNIYQGTLWTYVIDRVVWALVHQDSSHIVPMNRMCNEVRDARQIANAS